MSGSLILPIVRSEKEFKLAVMYDAAIHTKCTNCSMPFSNDVNHTPEGWLLATQKGICEDCLDDILDNVCGDPT